MMLGLWQDYVIRIISSLRGHSNEILFAVCGYIFIDRFQLFVDDLFFGQF